MLLAQPEQSMEAVRTSLQIWSSDVVPSLFPYMVLCRILADSMVRRGMPVFAVVSVLGLLGGSPAGAAALGACAALKAIPRKVLASLSATAGTVSPMFFLGTMARWFGKARICRMLLAAHILAAGIAGMIVYCVFDHLPDVQNVQSGREVSSQGGAIAQSVDAVLNVGGCIVFFSVLAALSGTMFPHLPPLFEALLHGMLEAAGGISALSGIGYTEHVRFILASGVLGFGGISILIQNHSFLRSCGIRLWQLILFGLLRSAAAVLITLLCFSVMR